jgi:Rieske Fe-S protein
MVMRDDPFPISESEERRLDRRRFLGVAGAAALLVAAGEWAGARAEVQTRQPDAIEPDIASLKLGESRSVVTADGREALAVKLTDGEIVAFDRRCPHLGCPVLWSAENQRFECPCHHAAFDARTGRVLFGPPRRGLTSVNVKVA